MKFVNVSTAIAATLAIAAVGTASAATELSSVKAGTYKVESYHTQVGFSISHFGFTNYSGLFSGATGSLQLDPTDPAHSKLQVVIPVQSIITTVPVLTTELKGDKWLTSRSFRRQPSRRRKWLSLLTASSPSKALSRCTG